MVLRAAGLVRYIEAGLVRYIEAGLVRYIRGWIGEVWRLDW